VSQSGLAGFDSNIVMEEDKQTEESHFGLGHLNHPGAALPQSQAEDGQVEDEDYSLPGDYDD
jgi:hypothetical protein